jgi:hypothetical protein
MANKYYELRVHNETEDFMLNCVIFVSTDVNRLWQQQNGIS